MSEPRHIKVVVTGGRDYADKASVNQVLGILGLEEDNEYHMPHDISIAHGGAKGADTLADDWAIVNWVPVHVYEAKWDEHGKKAGVLRNIEMLDDFKPDLVVAFPGGRGTSHCRAEAERRGIPVYLVPRGDNPEIGRAALLELRKEVLR